MKVRVTAEDNILIINMMMMNWWYPEDLATEDLAVVISSVPILGVRHHYHHDHYDHYIIIISTTIIIIIIVKMNLEFSLLLQVLETLHQTFMSNHLRRTLSETICLPNLPQDQLPGLPGHVDCEQNNANVLLHKLFAKPLETTIVKKCTTVDKSFGFSDIVGCDLWLEVNLKLATGKHLPFIIMIIIGGNMSMTKTHLTS